jgi:hypothetical protein
LNARPPAAMMRGMERLSTLTATQLQHHQTADLMRALSAKTFAPMDPAEYFAERWPRAVHRDLVVKHFATANLEPDYTHAATPPGTTTDAAWAAPLMVPALVAGFLPLVKAASVLGKLPLTPAPFNVKLAKQTAGSSTAWSGENSPKPVSKLGFGNNTLAPSKCVSIIVVTDELLRLAAPGSETLLANTIRDEVNAFVDREFLGATAAVAGVRPAGILAGVTPIVTTGTLAGDLAALAAAFFTARPSPFAPYFVFSPGTASKVAALDMGRDVTVNGGSLLGVPVVVSPGAASNAILLDAPAIYLADGGINLDTSREALLHMNDAPDAPPTAATVLVSLYQDNLVGIRAERFVSWVTVGANAVQYAVVA